MPDSVLDAIKMGIWDFEPGAESCGQFDSTRSLPGTKEKLEVLAERVRQGLPLWHEEDRLSFDDLESRQTLKSAR